ncbi:NRT2 ribosyltransferase, partial [Scytalopus superciliaris]|nr:NRT2 ribosyltransferase [Scytalopus superciliaris]
PTMELLPLVLVLLAGALATGTEEVALDMAPNAFDDQYRGCSNEMMAELPALNRSELATNTIFAKSWAVAAAKWHGQASPGSPLRPGQAMALLAYTSKSVHREFNAAVRGAGRSRREYLHGFHFKVLHFLLTEALADLRAAPSHPACLHVYRGVRGVRFTAQPGQTIRFGQFTSSSLDREATKAFGQDTFFEVLTCHGAAIQDFSFYPEEQEVLIPPFETFVVTSVTLRGNSTLIQLRPHGVHSNYNCEWLRGDIPGLGTGQG